MTKTHAVKTASTVSVHLNCPVANTDTAQKWSGRALSVCRHWCRDGLTANAPKTRTSATADSARTTFAVRPKPKQLRI
jgi:hypothetical protein